MVVLLPTLLNPLQVVVSLVERAPCLIERVVRLLLLLLMLPLEAAGVVLLPIPLGSLEVSLIGGVVCLMLPREAVVVVLLPTLLNPLQVVVSLVERAPRLIERVVRLLLLLLMLPLEAAGVVLLPIPLGSLEVPLIGEVVRLMLRQKAVVAVLLPILLILKVLQALKHALSALRILMMIVIRCVFASINFITIA
jgi:hypothetical protein